MDDKITRLANQQVDEDEDVIDDMIGYLVLLKIAKKIEAAGSFEEFIALADTKTES